jgi:protoporphyrin/coproporphyrin ferrochelatase
MTSSGSSGGPSGAILLNLGTPESPSTADVRRYLREFLMDPFVIDIPAPARWLLVHGLILPRRPASSARAYAQIWTERGSPLLFHLLDLAAEVGALLGPAWRVEPAMRYGQPSLETAARRLKGVREVVVFPLYPQYSLAATESSYQEARRVLARELPGVPLRLLGDFHAEPGFISSFAETIRETWTQGYDHLLYSFHGLPERQIRRLDSSGHCLSRADCCDRPAHPRCYRAQCYATARALTRALAVPADRTSVGFQSRLGRTPWIKPYTDHLYVELARQGVRRLAVACPAFVADCLETLEEVQIRGREAFRAAGGEELALIPSLNSRPSWARTVAGMVGEGR